VTIEWDAAFITPDSYRISIYDALGALQAEQTSCAEDQLPTSAPFYCELALEDVISMYGLEWGDNLIVIVEAILVGVEYSSDTPLSLVVESTPDQVENLTEETLYTSTTVSWTAPFEDNG
jgi:hypothetical protein